MNYNQLTTEQLLKEVENMSTIESRLTYKTEYETIICLLLNRIDLLDWTNNDNLDWPERLLRVL